MLGKKVLIAQNNAIRKLQCCTDLVIFALLFTGAAILHAEPLHVYLVPDALRQNLREILAFLIPLLDSFFKRVRWRCFRIAHILICAFVAEIVSLSFCQNHISVQPKKGHYRVDITPELFLKRDGRGCDDNRLVHAFAVQQHRHKIAKGLANAHASFNRKVLVVYEGVHNLK